MLEVRNLKICYDSVPAIHDVSLAVPEGHLTSIVGSNGAGKTTLLRTIIGHLHPDQGEIFFKGESIDRFPAHRVSRMGISLVSEGRGLFRKLTVLENLTLGAFIVKSKQTVLKQLDRVYSLFPILKERRKQISGTLSGGEQQMLAIARSLMADPALIMLDEPSLGVMPTFVQLIFATLNRIRSEGKTILLVEQNVERSLRIADWAYVLQTGRIVLEGKGPDLLKQDLIRKAYLGM